MILLAPQPAYSVTGVPSRRMTNTESDLFLSRDDGKFYFLVSGRWFTTDDLSSGQWTFATTDLPVAFAQPFLFITAASITSPACNAIASFSSVTLPSASRYSIRTVVGSATVTDCSLLQKSPRSMLAT